MKVGFIGLGRMGLGMAANLLNAGHEVTAYNRTPEKGRSLAAAGVTLVERVANACKGEIVFTMLSDDHAVEAVTYGADGVLRHLTKDAIHICCSTISVELGKRLAESHAQADRDYVSAPVFGRPEAAAAAQLFVVAAGKPGAITVARTVLDVIGQRTFVVSEQPHIANLVKLSGNFMIAAMIESLGEALALIDKAGVDRQAFVDILSSTLFPAPLYRNYGTLIASRKFSPAGFAAPLGHKDMRLVLAAAENLRVPMPLASLVRDRLVALLAAGGEQLDWSAIADLAARDAGTATSTLDLRRFAVATASNRRNSTSGHENEPPP